VSSLTRQLRSAPISADWSRAWASKARCLSSQLLGLAGPVADPAHVDAVLVADPESWPYGNFMLAWLDAKPEGRCVRHVADAAFFLELLALAYEPVLDAHPEFRVLLTDLSRPEMSITNDVLQIQLRGLELGAGYSMIRQHALMLFNAALWLDEPRRSQWLALYDELVDHVDRRPEGRPDLVELAAVERDAFLDFEVLASLSVSPATAVPLLSNPRLLARILDYQLYAGVAIGLVWREYRDVAVEDRDAWHRDQLSRRYVDPTYLEKEWTRT
jgi:hypothetical protein